MKSNTLIELSQSPEMVELSLTEQAAVNAFAEKERFDKAWISDRPNLASSFFRIEKIMADHPIELFGREVPVVVYNRISLYEDSQGNKPLFSFLMDDSTLTSMLLSSNTYGHNPATAYSIDQYRLMNYARSSNALPLEEQAKTLLDKPARFKAVFQSLVDEFDDTGKIKASSVDEISNSLSTISPLKFREFSQKIHTENLNKMRVDYQTEFCNMVSYKKLTDEAMLLEHYQSLVDPTSSDFINISPFGHAFQNMTREHSLAYKKLMEHAQIEIYLDKIREGVDSFTKEKYERNISIIKNNIENNYVEILSKKVMEDFSSLYNYVSNENILSYRERYESLSLCVNVNRRSMRLDNIHTDYNSYEQSVFEFEIERGYAENHYGRMKQRGYENVCKFIVTEADLMNMLQASYLDLRVPATITMIGYNTIEFNTSVKESVFDTIVSDSLTEAEVALAKQLNDIFLTKIKPFEINKPKTKKACKEYLAAINEYIEVYDSFKEESHRSSVNVLDQMTQATYHEIGGNIENMLTSININALPDIKTIKSWLLGNK